MTATGISALSNGIRRVTTGIDAAGRAIVVHDEIVRDDERALVLWATDAPPTAGDSNPPVTQGWWPPPGGVRVSLSTRAPERSPAAASRPQAWPDINDDAGFHASRSVDVIVIISGKIWLELDDGLEIELSAGDTLIQNGTRHRWHNHSDEWPLMAVVIVGTQSA